MTGATARRLAVRSAWLSAVRRPPLPSLPVVMVVPSLLALAPFFLVPLAVLARNSFKVDLASGAMLDVFTLENYARVATDPFYLRAFFNTALMAASTTVAAVVLGYPYAYFLVRHAHGRAAVLLWILYVPLVVSIVVRVYGWMVITSDSGVINSALLALHFIDSPIRLMFDSGSIFLGLLHRYLPFMVLPIVNSLGKVDESLVRVSLSLGADTWRTFRRVLLPLSLPGLVAGCQLVFASVLSDFVTPLLLGSARFPMLAPAIYDETVTNFRWALAAAMSVTMLMVIMLLLAITSVLVRRLAPWSKAL